MALFRDDRRIRPAKGRDGFDVRLPDDERELLMSLPGQLVELLDEAAGNDELMRQDPALARLYPDAYGEADKEHAEEFRRLMNEDLRERHRSALEMLASTASRDYVDAEELHAWMSAINQLRLVLGTRLGVTEDMDRDDLREDDPNFAAYNLYGYLSWLQEQVVEALSSTL